MFSTGCPVTINYKSRWKSYGVTDWVRLMKCNYQKETINNTDTNHPVYVYDGRPTTETCARSAVQHVYARDHHVSQ